MELYGSLGCQERSVSFGENIASRGELSNQKLEKERITFRFELKRCVAAGFLEAAIASFFLLIALRVFNCTPLEKGFLAGAVSFGLLFTPLIVWWATNRSLTVATGAKKILLVGSVSFLLASIAPNSSLFVFFAILGAASSSAVIPLRTQMYQDNYPQERRGTLYSKTNSVRIISCAVFSYLVGEILQGRLYLYPYLFIFLACSLLFESYCLSSCPSEPLKLKVSDNGETEYAGILNGFQFIKSDLVFRNTLICWMLMGFGNLMLVALRVEYLGDVDYGFSLPENQIALYLGVIPSCTRLLMSPIWGKLFDQMNFFALRITINLIFFIGNLTFFFSDTTTGLALGSFTFGLAQAGGDIAWSLWVTKFAPRERVSSYMAVHTFFTGVRGLIAPIVGFQLLNYMSMKEIGLFCGALILVANVPLFGEIKRKSSLGLLIKTEIE